MGFFFLLLVETLFGNFIPRQFKPDSYEKNFAQMFEISIPDSQKVLIKYFHVIDAFMLVGTLVGNCIITKFKPIAQERIFQQF